MNNRRWIRFTVFFLEFSPKIGQISQQFRLVKYEYSIRSSSISFTEVVLKCFKHDLPCGFFLVVIKDTPWVENCECLVGFSPSTYTLTLVHQASNPPMLPCLVATCRLETHHNQRDQTKRRLLGGVPGQI